MIESVTATLLKAWTLTITGTETNRYTHRHLDNSPHHYNAATEAAGVPGEDVEPEDVFEAAEVERDEQHWQYKFS